ncbi:MAG: hypothetical protein E6R13_08590 [Spirochaetes bacterium]|nr:MAG: hypothetical protein E6R13_08590 [Spirochaetota bacterium]
MNSSVFKKSISEKATLKAVKKKYNDNKRKAFKFYTKHNSSFGLKSNDLSMLDAMLRVADAIEIELVSQK